MDSSTIDNTEFLSLSSCAEKLGITTRELRYHIEKDNPVPDRRIEMGKYRVRFFTMDDFYIVESWWRTKHNG